MFSVLYRTCIASFLLSAHLMFLFHLSGNTIYMKKNCSSWEKSAGFVVYLDQDSSLSNSAAEDYLRRSLIAQISKWRWFVRMSAWIACCVIHAAPCLASATWMFNVVVEGHLVDQHENSARFQHSHCRDSKEPKWQKLICDHHHNVSWNDHRRLFRYKPLPPK
jgi:hypothetical protein